MMWEDAAAVGAPAVAVGDSAAAAAAAAPAGLDAPDPAGSVTTERQTCL